MHLKKKHVEFIFCGTSHTQEITIDHLHELSVDVVRILDRFRKTEKYFDLERVTKYLTL